MPLGNGPDGAYQLSEDEISIITDFEEE